MYIKSDNSIVNRIYQSILINQELLISSVVYGQRYIGKSSMLKEIYNDATWVDARNFKDIQKVLENSDKVVIENFEEIKNIDNLNFDNKHVIALYNSKNSNRQLENKFAFIYNFPPLQDRETDLEIFANNYINEYKELYNLDANIELNPEVYDLSDNLKSLKSSIFKELTIKNLSKDDVHKALYNYFLHSDVSENIYNMGLKIFDKAIIDAGLKKYKSQLQVTKRFGISRNTLRKKIDELE